MIVYIEYVLIDNFVIDFLLLKATFTITGYPYRKGRLFLCAFLGSIFALFFPLLKINSIILSVIKLLFGLILIAVSARFKTKRSFFVSVVIFLLLTFLVGGGIVGACEIFDIGSGNEILISAIAIPACLIIKAITSVIKSLYRNRLVKSFFYKVEISAFNKNVLATGFLDTGNTLYYLDSPAIICSKSFFERNFNIVNFLAVAKKIEFMQVTGKNSMFVTKIDSLKIYLGDEVNIFNNVSLCVAKGEVIDGADVILHTAFLEVNSVNSNNNKIKKVS